MKRYALLVDDAPRDVVVTQLRRPDGTLQDVRDVEQGPLVGATPIRLGETNLLDAAKELLGADAVHSWDPPVIDRDGNQWSVLRFHNIVPRKHRLMVSLPTFLAARKDAAQRQFLSELLGAKKGTPRAVAGLSRQDQALYQLVNQPISEDAANTYRPPAIQSYQVQKQQRQEQLFQRQQEQQRLQQEQQQRAQQQHQAQQQQYQVQQQAQPQDENYEPPRRGGNRVPLPPSPISRKSRSNDELLSKEAKYYLAGAATVAVPSALLLYQSRKPGK